MPVVAVHDSTRALGDWFHDRALATVCVAVIYAGQAPMVRLLADFAHQQHQLLNQHIPQGMEFRQPPQHFRASALGM